MPATQFKKPEEYVPPSVLSSTQKCAVEEREDGAVVHFRIDPTEWARLKRKMGTQDPALFLWDNMLYRNIIGMVY